ncbi:MAG: AzlD domain-containing protein [Acidimicrobiia bacterium]|nr:AzlD domain-containing protein [Acidimicrobiia bacterium]
MSPWLTVIVIGTGTYLTRLSFVGVLGARSMPAWAERPLAYVAPSVLAALVLPAVLLRDGGLDLTPAGNPRFLAALAAAVIVIRYKSVSWSIVVGMAMLWLLQWLV